MAEDDKKTSDDREAGQSDNNPPLATGIDEDAASDIDAEPELTLEVLEALKSSDPEIYATLTEISRSWQGPLPPPEILKEYPESIQTTFNDNWLEESRHRRKLAVRGQIFAAVIALSAISGAVAAAFLEQPYVGAAIVFAAFGAIAATGLIHLFPWKR